MNRFISRPTGIAGVLLIERWGIADARGSFSSLFSDDELAACGWLDPVRQVNHSITARRGTVRGLHYLASPYTEDKLVSCVRGAVFDVAVDLLGDGVELVYLHSDRWIESADSGIDPLDPRLAIPWPLPVEMVSSKDRSQPRIDDAFIGLSS